MEFLGLQGTGGGNTSVEQQYTEHSLEGIGLHPSSRLRSRQV